MFSCNLPPALWQNDRDFLRATVVTRGWNGYRNKSQHRKSTLEKKILPPFQQGFEPATFQSRVRCSNHWAIPAPWQYAHTCGYIAIGTGPTVHWLFRSYDLFSKFSSMAKPKPHEVSADHSLNNITLLSSLEYRRATNLCACSLPFRHKSESGRTWCVVHFVYIYLIFENTNQGSKRLKTHFLLAYLSGTVWLADVIGWGKIKSKRSSLISHFGIYFCLWGTDFLLSCKQLPPPTLAMDVKSRYSVLVQFALDQDIDPPPLPRPTPPPPPSSPLPILFFSYFLCIQFV